MKASALIESAFTLAGRKALGQPIDGDSKAQGLELLQMLVDSWQAQGIFIPYTTEIVQSVTGSPVTIGTGGTINTTRPLRVLDTSFFRINSIDYPIKWVDEAEFNLIWNKTITEFTPRYGFYDHALPLGNLYFWPKPTAYELHLRLDAILPAFVDYDTDYNIEIGYTNAIKLSLAEYACMGIKEVPQSIGVQAEKARKAIIQNNMQVPIWSKPSITRGVNNGRYYPLPSSYP